MGLSEARVQVRRLCENFWARLVAKDASKWRQQAHYAVEYKNIVNKGYFEKFFSATGKPIIHKF